MPSRPRRARLLVFAVFAVIVFFLYTRNAETVDDYADFVKEKTVGGGAVIRPPAEDVPAPPPPPASPPRPQPEPAPEKEVEKEEDQDLFKPLKPQIPSTSASVKTSLKTSSTSTNSPATPEPLTSAPSKPQPAPVSEDDDEELGDGRKEIEDVPAPTIQVPHWTKQPERFPISSTTQLPSGSSIPLPRIQRATEKLAENGVDQQRLDIVKGVSQHAWKGYRECAFAQDEIRPVSCRSNNPFNGWGATLVDSLDTIWIMGMTEEFEEAVEAVRKIDFTTSVRGDVPLFETVIRYLGGLVAAYDVSGRKYRVLLDKAVELAEVLYGAFDTPNRVPVTYYRWRPSSASLPHKASNRVVLAEIGTLSMEFTRLAQLALEPKYYDAIARLTDLFEEWQNSTRMPGMFPTTFDSSGCGRPVQVQSTQTEKQKPVAPQIAPGLVMTEEDKKKNWDDVHRPSGDNTNDPTIVKGGIKRVEDGLEDGDHYDTDIKRKLLNAPNERRQLNVIANEDGGTVKKSQGAGGSGIPRSPSTMIELAGDDACIPQGFLSSSKNTPETFTLSGASDSMYEYLPKEYLLLGGQEEKYRDMYLASAATAIEKLLYKPMTKDERDILLTGEIKIGPNYSQPIESRGYIEKFTSEAAHLACFAGGMFAMGGVLFDKEEHVKIGSKLTDGCVWAYNVTATGVMPEGAVVMPCPDTWGECPWDEKAYWKELDPYEETRLAPPPPPVTPPKPSVQLEPTKPDPSVKPGPDVPLERTRPDRSADPNERDPGEDVATKITKRQLEGSPEEAARGPAPAPAPAPPQGVTPEASASPQPPAPAPATPPDWDEDIASATVQEDDTVYIQPTPLSHEEFVRNKIEDERLPPGYLKIGGRRYILRPEAIESVFYMYRITGDQYWRDVGWNMFTAIDRHTRAPHGNSAIDDMTKAAPELLDQMESFWLAETLKYFYLLYDDPDKWSLDEWVLNTEAHLFRRPPYEFA